MNQTDPNERTKLARRLWKFLKPLICEWDHGWLLDNGKQVRQSQAPNNAVCAWLNEVRRVAKAKEHNAGYPVRLNWRLKPNGWTLKNLIAYLQGDWTSLFQTRRTTEMMKESRAFSGQISASFQRGLRSRNCL